ncbi:MAG: glycine--tRNA ligase subunit beta [Acidobacteriia bacterium]|nr:glycine--tRNA ligase subunit beta [Terriglobia bacterium]
MADFLLEIGLEEIPARMIDGAETELGARVAKLLVDQRLDPGDAQVPTFSTPRRLAVLARGILESQADTEEQVLGPSVKVAYKDGQPTPAAQAFARKVKVDVAHLKTVTTAKGEYLAATVARRGRTAQEILAASLPQEINALYWAKSMYWREGKPERFVRPVRWMVALLGNDVVPLEYAGIKAARRSQGHRLLGHDFEVKAPSSYAAELKEAGVLARREERLTLIRKELDDACRTIVGARWREDKELLGAVVNLTEYPSVILGNFEREFLSLPEEVLVTVMRDHQKYFAVEDADGKLAPHFLAVLNTSGDPTGIVRHGHERVLRARFSDAHFFWTVDQKHPLRERVDWLKNVTFQKDLGSYHDKTVRVQKLASQVSQTLEDAGVKLRAGIVHKAALLAKTDLTTELVKEFTELQGVVGGLYAKAQGIDPAIGDAIYDQYKPESMEDAVPRTVEGAVISIADKADSIAGMFALGLTPSGSKDPFALRRQANGIIKTIAEHKLPLDLPLLFRDALAGYAGSEAQKKFTVSVQSGEGRAHLLATLAAFYRERVEFYLREALGFAYDVVNAVLAAGANDVVDVVARAQAVATVRESEDFEAISAAFKRIKNILRQAKETGKNIARPYEIEALEPKDRTLVDAMRRIGSQIAPLKAEGEYLEALNSIATLRPIVDSYFDDVMVMVDDDRLRKNRLGLLQALCDEFSTIADFSEIVTEKK